MKQEKASIDNDSVISKEEIRLRQVESDLNKITETLGEIFLRIRTFETILLENNIVSKEDFQKKYLEQANIMNELIKKDQAQQENDQSQG